MDSEYTPQRENEEHETLINPIELSKLDVSIGKYSPELLVSLLEDPSKVNYLYSTSVEYEGASSNVDGVLVSNREKPAVLVEANASFCSIIITFDHENAVLLHSHFTPPGDIDEFEFLPEVDDKIVTYFREVRKNIRRNENATILTGHTDSTENNANLVIEALAKLLGQAYSNIFRYTEIRDLEKVDLRSAGGLVFIPKQLSKIKRNIILFEDGTIDIKEIKRLHTQS
jgi:hypothetical protein